MEIAKSAAYASLNLGLGLVEDQAMQKCARFLGIQTEVNTLKNTMSRIKAMIIDTSKIGTIEYASAVEFQDRLQRLAYIVEDVLDDVVTEGMHPEMTTEEELEWIWESEAESVFSKVRKLVLTYCTKLSVSHRLRPKLDIIIADLQHLENQKDDLRFIVNVVDKTVNNSDREVKRGNKTSMLEYKVIGRANEKDRVLKKLLEGESSRQSFTVLPIVGMGGLGKTTLARLLYNDTKVKGDLEVKGHFELRAWVSVSDKFDITIISQLIFRDMFKEMDENLGFNQLQLALKEKIKGKRFLVVLDNVWNVDCEIWEDLVAPFHCGAPGSRIIMTTRHHEFPKKLGYDLNRLNCLMGEDALSLLAIYALGEDNFESHPTLKATGEKIVEKCGGLPLALKVIGRILREKGANDNEWNVVLKNEIWNLNLGDSSDPLVPALMLSYHYLSANLKLLFAYCSLFPKNFLFDKEELVLLWMAEGYLNQPLANISQERVGHEYFEKLVSMSFFEHASNDKSMFVMHDLMNDLARFVSKDYFISFDKTVDEVKYRHMSFIREEYVAYKKFKDFKMAKNLRTFIATSDRMVQNWKWFYLSDKVLAELLPKLPLLRVLSLSRFRITEVPESIGSLKHLRYLNLSQSRIKELPESVSNLCNLQTLIVFGCKSLTKLPKSFLKLKQLRHFDISDTPLENLPLGIGELKSLQTLTRIIIGGDGGFSITELNGLENLHGKISIEGLHNVQSPMHAHEANLSQKMLTKLELKWKHDEGSQQGTLEKAVLDELQPNSAGLEELAIESYGGTELSNWVGDPSFEKLVHVSISGCRECTSLPPLGQLRSLKQLFVKGMNKVEEIGSELNRDTNKAFPSLEILEFQDMLEWSKWKTSQVAFPCLRELRIKKCPKLTDVKLIAIPSLRVLITHKCKSDVLKSVVGEASSINKLEIKSISGLTDEMWGDVTKYLGAVEELSMSKCNDISYLWKSGAEASKVLENLKILEFSYT
ncbi:putative P-loop containing nucleoside triphosphate hydrolase, leucine-rich repeat domain superfamily [Helianthus annuus]|nr:putative P-loop containing nucleoside triphosphate hydrolase, leucine-rich repeat domain superfamily [Helianthus annuus]